MIWTMIAGLSLLFASISALVYTRNIRHFRTVGQPSNARYAASILIPARNEAASIESCVEAALQTTGIDFEVVVLDDHSTDETAAIVARIAARDSRVRLETGSALPAGWCGKQHACFILAQLAKRPLLCFIDADVQIAPHAIARIADFVESSGCDYVSGFPQQVMETFLKRLLIPMMYFVLLAFLPLKRMRRSLSPSYAAGNGQLVMIRRESYEKCGGHELIKASLHDGLTLPRTFRHHGFKTDLFDAGDLALCRMYRSSREVWFGLAKNAQ